MPFPSCLRVIVSLPLPLLLTACGGVQGRTAEAAEGVLRDWVESVAAGDVDACDLETEPFARIQNDQMAYYTDDGEAPDCPGRVEQYDRLVTALGADYDGYLASVEDADYETVEASEDEVVVEVTLTQDDTDAPPTVDTYSLTYVDDEWLVSDSGGHLAPDVILQGPFTTRTS